MQLILATHNPGKAEEMKKLLQGLPLEILSLDELGIDGEVEETGATTEENALIKARFAMAKTGQMAVADDTGLYIDALNGAPGIHAARWAGDDYPKAQLAAYTLERLKDMPLAKRTAYFKTTAALVFPNGNYEIFAGEIKGLITEKEYGQSIFPLPYDRIFMPDGFVQTFAQMTKDQKNAISHRAQAFGKLREFLLSMSS